MAGIKHGKITEHTKQSSLSFVQQLPPCNRTVQPSATTTYNSTYYSSAAWVSKVQRFDAAPRVLRFIPPETARMYTVDTNMALFN